MSSREPFKRHRRLRQSPNLRANVRENHVRTEDLIYPLFAVEGTGVKNEVPSMPGVYQRSLDLINDEVQEAVDLGITMIILFGVPNDKDACGTSAMAEDGIVQKATRQIKEAFPELTVITDTCLCQFTDHGHCGVVEDGEILNDPSLELLTKAAVSQAKAGADVIAPSNMMDGFVHAIREGLDEAGFSHVPIMSYAVKYASAFYGPFRDAAHSSPKSGDRKTYQMDPANRREAHREARSDADEGADFLIVKPALSYLDIIRDVRDRHDLPVVAYNVSGEYSMVKAASMNGWINERDIVMEKMVSMKRAGADLILTYFAKDIARWVNE
ncbi:porphobilinogen synthase [Salisediminibacterium selenitireducens]|uniref:Delta-aminolevulinic acid dehydratase n=1 Tax=Bacillus selenitireducens (strain ATCC 700615 / DSM 15326 / MLS10) TaxID=439292 RepID=D6XSZ9_BACIE|nr:porphobilinogen synthase [Salisediminibacterium selenitireducens]ADH98935.1 Porphobilinogen synthase [[Bacillus] selenitireducens MLS10]